MLWVRELIGWILIAVSLYVIYVGLSFAMNLETPKLVEAGVLCFTGLGILRAGTYLVRVATAARVYGGTIDDTKLKT